MRKPTICLCENKDADQMCSSKCIADQRQCSFHTDSTNTQSFKLLALCCDCTAWFVSDLVGNPNCWFLMHMLNYVTILLNMVTSCLSRHESMTNMHVYVQSVNVRTAGKTILNNKERTTIFTRHGHKVKISLDAPH